MRALIRFEACNADSPCETIGTRPITALQRSTLRYFRQCEEISANGLLCQTNKTTCNRNLEEAVVERKQYHTN